MARIELENVGKAWGKVLAVDGMDLAIEDGEFVAVLGPSGCGKSTTLFMLAGIYAPTSGTVRFDGAVVNEVESRDRNVGIVFQSYALYPHMTVRQNIMFPLKFQALGKEDALERAEAAARLVHVDDLLERKPAEMSGGQQQRVALARALVKRPQILLLDEPLSNLDASLRLAMRAEIKRLQRKLGLTTILVTHDQIEATTMADRVVCMNEGRVEQVGPADDLYLRPASLFVAGFIGAPPINLMEGRAAGGSVRIGEATLSLSVGAHGEVTVGIRPEHISFAERGVAGRVEQIEPMGREVLYLVDSAMGSLRVLEGGSGASRAIGDEVRLGYDERATLVFDTASGVRLPDLHAGAPG